MVYVLRAAMADEPHPPLTAADIVLINAQYPSDNVPTAAIDWTLMVGTATVAGTVAGLNIDVTPSVLAVVEPDTV